MTKDIAIAISHDEALVLFELFSRFEENNQLTLEHNSEYVALSRIAAQIDRSLVEPFSPDYPLLLHQAKSRVAAGYEGLAPGVIRGEA